jgi:hypothetical protein
MTPGENERALMPKQGANVRRLPNVVRSGKSMSVVVRKRKHWKFAPAVLYSLCRVRGRRRILPVAGNDRLLLVSHGGGSLCFSRRRCCGSRTSIWAVLGDWLIQYPERERLHSSRGAKTGLLFGPIKVPSLGQVEVQLHELQVLLLLPSLPRAAILLLAH